MMTTITTGTKAIDTRDGRLVTIGEKNSKYKTVIVYYDDPKENEVNGKSVGYNTIKKHFEALLTVDGMTAEEIDAAAPAEVEKVEEKPTAEKKEQKKEKKEKKEKKARAKKDSQDRRDFINKWFPKVTEAGFGIKSWETSPNLYQVKRILESGKLRTVGELRMGLNTWSINLKADIADQIDLEDYEVKEQKYTLPIFVKAGYDEAGDNLFNQYLETIA